MTQSNRKASRQDGFHSHEALHYLRLISSFAERLIRKEREEAKTQGDRRQPVIAEDEAQTRFMPLSYYHVAHPDGVLPHLVKRAYALEELLVSQVAGIEQEDNQYHSENHPSQPSLMMPQALKIVPEEELPKGTVTLTGQGVRFDPKGIEDSQGGGPLLSPVFLLIQDSWRYTMQLSRKLKPQETETFDVRQLHPEHEITGVQMDVHDQLTGGLHEPRPEEQEHGPR